MQPKDPQGVRTAIQCLEQTQPILHETASSTSSDIPDLLTDADTDSTSQPDSDTLADHVTAPSWSCDEDSDDDEYYLPADNQQCGALFTRANILQNSDASSDSTASSGEDADSEASISETTTNSSD